MIRIAAVGDPHVAAESAELWRRGLEPVNRDADLLVVAGDLTRHGSEEESEALAQVFSAVRIPYVGVLGNHDHQSDRAELVIAAFERHGGRILEGEHAVIAVGSARVGIAGAKGFGGGFMGACAADFGEPEMKAFVHTTRLAARALRTALDSLDTDLRIALLHYAPIPGTLSGEKPEIYPFLGSYLLAEAIDGARVDLVVHGHAHHGIERGATAGGVPVRNVAAPVLRSPYRVYALALAPGRLEGRQLSRS